MASTAARLDAAQVEDRRNLRRVVTASFIGTTIEWYDFFLYGTAAALVFGELFFPGAESADRDARRRFGTFAVGFAARPLGGIVFGHFGDRVGRKSMLVLSLLIMGLATFLIGCLPTHASIGIAAPILLVLLRFAQGIGVGGEWGGAVLMAVEHAPKGKRGLFGAFPQMGVPAGLLLSTVVFTDRPEPDHRGAVHGLGLAHPVPRLDRARRRRPRSSACSSLESPAFKEVKESGTDVREAARRARQDPQARRADRDGHADRRERHVLHLHRVRPGLRRGHAEAVEEHDAHRRDHRRGARACSRPVLWQAVRPCRAPEALHGGRGVHARCSRSRSSRCSTRRSRCSSGSRSCSPSTSATT